MDQPFVSVFWSDLAEDLKSPELLRAYLVMSVRIETVDRVMDQIDDARVAAGLSKAALARAIGAHPGAVRRLLTGRCMGRAVGGLAEVAAVLGLRVTLEPLDESE